MPKFVRSDQAVVHVSIPGLALDNESWDVIDGFDNEVTGLKVYPGGSADGVALGGIPKRSAGTVERLWSDTIIGVFKELDGAAGGVGVTVTYANTNPDKKVKEVLFTYTGTLGTVTRPKYKSGTSEEAMLKIMVDANDSLT